MRFILFMQTYNYYLRLQNIFVVSTSNLFYVLSSEPVIIQYIPPDRSIYDICLSC